MDTHKSDSANLDSAFELLVRAGKETTESLMALVPEAYTSLPDLDSRPELKAFYEYHAGIQEAWDGPALLVFSDGKMMGAKLDRNGLRPARYVYCVHDVTLSLLLLSRPIFGILFPIYPSI